MLIGRCDISCDISCKHPPHETCDWASLPHHSSSRVRIYMHPWQWSGSYRSALPIGIYLLVLPYFLPLTSNLSPLTYLPLYWFIVRSMPCRQNDGMISLTNFNRSGRACCSCSLHFPSTKLHCAPLLKSLPIPNRRRA